MKKKSKSIDNFEKYKSTSMNKDKNVKKKNANNLSMSSVKRSDEEMNMKMHKPIYKKSLDLTPQ